MHMSILKQIQSAWPENDPDQEVAGHLREVQQIGQRASHQGCRKHQAESKCNVAKYFHRKQSVALKLSLDTATERPIPRHRASRQPGPEPYRLQPTQH